jgi:elongation factor Ts
MAITTEQIKELREATGVGILACREALEHASGDYEKAVDYLREKGLAKAAKRAGREASDGTIKLYSHGEGRIGVMVEVNCETDFVARSENFLNLAHEISLQIAASSPLVVNEDDLSEEMIERERTVAHNRAREEGKPENMLDKIAEGRIAKFKEEVVLLNQPYIRDESKTVQDLVNEAVAAMGENVIVRRFERYELGEHTGDEDSEE